MKAYRAYNTILVLLLNSSKVKNLRIRFQECAGGSIYFANDKDIIDAIENNPQFGTSFFEDKSFASKEEKTETAVKKDDEIKKIEVSGLNEAKAYLADKYEIPRTSLRSKVAIMEAAEAHKIQFTGI